MTTLTVPAHRLRPGDLIELGLESLTVTRVDQTSSDRVRIDGVLGFDHTDLRSVDPDLVATISINPEASFSATRPAR